MPRHEFSAIGTSWAIVTPEPLTSADQIAVHQRVADFDATYSRFRPDSLVSQVGRGGRTQTFPDDLGPLLECYRRLYDATDGGLTPTVGGALEHLGYDADYSLTARAGTVTIPRWEDALQVQGTTITTTRAVTLDFGAAGKGYLVDLLVRLLMDRGHPAGTVDGSGDLRQWGPDSLMVGLENPFDPRQAIGVAQLANRALCGSASNRRRWGNDSHHIVDGHSGRPVRDVIATWVVADTALEADGVATALFVCAPDILAERFEFEFVQVFADGSARFSADFPGELFS